MAVKYNVVSLRHKHSPETLFILRIQFIHNVPTFTSNVRQSFHISNHFLSSKILFHFFILFYFILFFKKFYFNFFFRKNFVNSVHEQCPNSDSKTVLSPKTEQVHSVHSQLTQPARPGAHRRSQARVRMAVSWALRPSRGRGPRPCRRR